MDSYRILIIDDHPLVRSGICAMLEQRGNHIGIADLRGLIQR